MNWITNKCVYFYIYGCLVYLTLHQSDKIQLVICFLFSSKRFTGFGTFDADLTFPYKFLPSFEYGACFGLFSFTNGLSTIAVSFARFNCYSVLSSV